MIKRGLSFSVFATAEKVVPFILIPFITNFLGIEELGKYAIYAVTLEFLFAFTQFATQEFILVSDKENESSTLLNSIFLSFITSGIFLLIFALITTIIELTFTIGIITFIYLVSKSVISSFCGLFRKRFDLYNYSMVISLSTLFPLIFGIYGGYLQKTYFGVVGGLSLGNLISSIIIIFLQRENLLSQIKFLSKTAIIKQLHFGLPVAFSRFGTWLQNSSGKYLTAIILDTKSVGILTSCMLFFTGLEILSDGISKGFIPQLYARKGSDKLDFLKKLKLFLVVVLVFFGIILFTLRRLIFINYLGLDFLPQYDIYIILILFGALVKGASKYELSLIYKNHKTAFISKLYLTVGVISATLSIFGLKYYGLITIFCVFLISQLFQYIKITRYDF